ncbi:MAG: hypothetical protein U0441_15020 [Polyangiaceae bacterium]
MSQDVAPENAEKPLWGRFRSEPRESEYGMSYIELDFAPERDVTATVVFTAGGERMSQRGLYRVKEGALFTDVLNHGLPLRFELDGDELTIEDGKEKIRYQRLPAEDGA